MSIGIDDEPDELHGVISLLVGLPIEEPRQSGECLAIEVRGDGHVLQRGAKFVADLAIHGCN